jgi:acyl-CoA oxidase
MLDTIQEKGQLGCFLLTEMQAGVLSGRCPTPHACDLSYLSPLLLHSSLLIGLIVETTCDWDEDSQEFILHTPSDKAAKNWISQGYTAELGVVIADLRIKGKSYGPHPFFLNLRDEGGGLLPGIRIEDMGTKTVRASAKLHTPPPAHPSRSTHLPHLPYAWLV